MTSYSCGMTQTRLHFTSLIDLVIVLEALIRLSATVPSSANGIGTTRSRRDLWP